MELLQQYLENAQSTDNETRKVAETQLLGLKQSDPENYCIQIFNSLSDQAMSQNVRVLAAILLRRAFLASQDHDKN